MQALTSRELIICRKLTLFFTYTDNYTKSCELTLCRGIQCTYISQYVVVKNIPLQQKYYVFRRNILPKTQKLITLAKCSSSVCPIVLVKCSGYTRIILCYVSTRENRKWSQLLQNMVLNAQRVVRIGYSLTTIDEWNAWMKATTKSFFWVFEFMCILICTLKLAVSLLHPGPLILW